MRDKLIKLIASCLFIGYIPLGSGTASSFAALLLYLFIGQSMPLYVIFTLSFLIIGFLISPMAEDVFGVKDSPKIVIDEFAAMLIVFFKIPPTFLYLFLGFIIFRILDFLKPYPAGKIERLHLSISVMADDLIAAVYANIILQIVLFLSSYLKI